MVFWFLQQQSPPARTRLLLEEPEHTAKSSRPPNFKTNPKKQVQETGAKHDADGRLSHDELDSLVSHHLLGEERSAHDDHLDKQLVVVVQKARKQHHEQEGLGRQIWTKVREVEEVEL